MTRTKKTLMLALSLTTIFALALFLNYQKTNAATSKMEIIAIDLLGANTGEATMISGSGGTPLLVDSGDNHNRSIFDWLDSNGYKNKEFNTLVTHWHDDHAGNTAEIIRRYNVGTVYIPDPSYLYKEESAYYRYERGYYTRLREAAHARGTKIEYLKKGMTISAGDGVTGRVIYCYESPRWESSAAVHYINNQSAVIMFEGGGARFLMAADVEKPAENRILNSGINIRADIFKMSHHGYETSNQQRFLEAVDPTYAYFTSSAATSSYFNPPAVRPQVRRMSEIANVLSTRYNGTLKYTCYNGIITVRAERNINRMYQRLFDKETGATRQVTYDFCDVTDIKKPQKILNTKRYYNWQLNADGSMFSGSMKTYDGRKCLVRNNVYAYNTFAENNGRIYWFDIYGRMKEDPGFFSAYDKRYYMGPHRLTGWKTINDKRYYFVDSSCAIYTKNREGMLAEGFNTINGKLYYFMDPKCVVYRSSDAGERVLGFFKVKNRTYYAANEKMSGYAPGIRGVIQRGWRTIAGRLYYLDTNGVMRTGWRTIDGKRYYMNSAGVAQQNKFVTINGKKYYFDKKGVMQTGLIKAGDGKSYYADKDGVILTGFIIVGDDYYLTDEDGAIQTGMVTSNGKKYYAAEDGTVSTGLFNAKGKSYYAAEDGSLQTGPIYVHGKLLLFGTDMYRITDPGWYDMNGRSYYINSRGEAVTGPVKIGPYTYYFSEMGELDTGRLRVNDVDIDCHLDEDKNPVTGWHEIDGVSYYSNEDGQLVSGRLEIDGIIYIFDEKTHELLGTEEREYMQETETDTAPPEEASGVDTGTEDSARPVTDDGSEVSGPDNEDVPAQEMQQEENTDAPEFEEATADPVETQEEGNAEDGISMPETVNETQAE